MTTQANQQPQTRGTLFIASKLDLDEYPVGTSINLLHKDIPFILARIEIDAMDGLISSWRVTIFLENVFTQAIFSQEDLQNRGENLYGMAYYPSDNSFKFDFIDEPYYNGHIDDEYDMCIICPNYAFVEKWTRNTINMFDDY